MYFKNMLFEDKTSLTSYLFQCVAMFGKNIVDPPYNDSIPSGHLVRKWRRINVDATSSRRINVNTTSFLHQMPAGFAPKHFWL